MTEELARTVVAVAPHALAKKLLADGWRGSGRSNKFTATVYRRYPTAAAATAALRKLDCVAGIDGS